MSTDLDFALLIDAEQLLPQLNHPMLRIIDLSRASVHAQLHLPNAIHVKPNMLVQQNEYATGQLPDEAALQQLMIHLNISKDHHVVAYDDEGGAWASRLLWTLHCLGFQNTSLLNGGIHAWLAAGFPTQSQATELLPVDDLFIVPQTPTYPYRIEYPELLQKLEQQEVQLWDCRSKEEYTGQRLAARRGGHIPGAYHFEWSTALNRENHLKLHPLERTQQRLAQLGLRSDQPVVVYCQSHHRSALAYVIARLLGWQVLAYDGAWSEWGNHPNSPIVSGEHPF